MVRKSDEFYIDGTDEDAPLHDPILNNPEADAATRLATARRVMEDHGFTAEQVAKLYGVDPSLLETSPGGSSRPAKA